MEMPGKMRGETRAMREASREYAHHHGLLSTLEHAALVSMLVTRESTDKVVRQHSAPKDSPSLPTAHTSNHSHQAVYPMREVVSCRLAKLNASRFVIWWIGKLMDVRVFCVFSSVDTAGGLYKFQ